MPELSEGLKYAVLALSVPGLYCGLVLLGRRLKRRHGVRLGWLYHVFAIGLAVYFPAEVLQLPWPALVDLGAAVVMLGAVVVMALVDRYVWDFYFQQRHRVSVPKFFTEVARLGILVLAVFLVLKFCYGKPIKELLIAPGIAVAAVGLAMQDLLGNIIAGMALQVGKPFVQGEWLSLDNRYAEVIEINWRSTRLLTNDDICIEIPNRELARQTIVNLNRPQRLVAMRIAVVLDYACPPNRVKDVLLQAAAQAPAVAREPKPKVFLKNFGESGIEYEIKFWMDNLHLYNDACDAIRTHVWYGLRRAGLSIPYPTRTLHLVRPERDTNRALRSDARDILRHQALFRGLTEEQLDDLVPRGRTVHFGREESLIHQGHEGDSMFILVHGQARVVVERNGERKPVATLTSGDCFGEMSLLTGERRIATVIADTDCEVVEIGKPVLARSLKEHPALLTQLSDLLARRQLETEGILAAQAADSGVLERRTKYAATFIDKLRTFFQL